MKMKVKQPPPLGISFPFLPSLSPFPHIPSPPERRDVRRRPLAGGLVFVAALLRQQTVLGAVPIQCFRFFIETGLAWETHPMPAGRVLVDMRSETGLQLRT